MINNSPIPTQITDDIQKEVNRIWIEEPGCGVRGLMQKLESLQLASEITKKRVKAAKQAVPYRFVEPENDADGDNDDINRGISVEFVERKIEERTSVRSLRRYKDSDEIMKGLTAMGILLDDGMKTWTIGKKDASDINNEPPLSNEEIMAQQNEGIACQYCNRYFASKNLVFRHLRDVSSGCGNAIFANGEKVPDAPSSIAKQSRQEAAKLLRRKKTGKAKQRSDPNSTLWLGDVPIPYTRMGGQYRRLRAVLREYLPRDVPQPWIKKVVRKAYRKGGTDVVVSGEEENENGESERERGEYFGYAIVVFRDEEEAKNVKAAMDGIEIKTQNVFPPEYDCTGITPSFVIKVKNVQHNTTSSAGNAGSNGNGNGCNTDTEANIPITCGGGGQDPPLMDQLRPLSIPELQERCQYLRARLEADGQVFVPPEASAASTAELENEDIATSPSPGQQEEDKMLEMTVALYNAVQEREGPTTIRTEIHNQGRIIPESIRSNLLHLLKNVRWPAASHRKGLTSDHYLVLQTNVTNDRFYNDLRVGCRELMDWADADYYYSGIAVTKNFVASPHMDDRDRSFQYAVSLGDFKNGGELCVEGKNDDGESPGPRVDYVNVVETRNRIAKVDGRNVHWVRSWDGYGVEDRYSLIFYDTTERHPTDVVQSGIILI